MLWTRSLAIIGVSEWYKATRSDDLIYLEGGAVIAIVGSALLLHLYVWPYEYPYQNCTE